MKSIGTFVSALFLTVFLSVFCSAEEFVFPERLPDHPRLYLTKQREDELKKLMKTDEFLKKQIEELLKKADRTVQEPPTDYKIPDGKRLLGQSRRSLNRTSTLAFAYRMTGKKEYADKAIEEMLAVCRFKDWNPKHYLDTGEMALAVGLGFDWLYDLISEEQRREIVDAMVRHAMQTGLSAYEKGAWWSKAHNNWNEVCNAGLTAGALAIADEEREIAEKIVRHAIKSFSNGLSVYKPDGAYPEGPVYWAYGATFSGCMIMVLNDVFGHDFGFLKTEGFEKTGDYYMGMCGPRYRSFNYADAGDGVDPSPMMYALSLFYDRPDYAYWLREFVRHQNRYQSGRFAVFHAVWYNPRGTASDFAETPLAAKYRGIQDVTTMRTAWSDPDAAFLGFKAGNNRANHGHLDIGSFVYDVGNERWAWDLGADNYNFPGYFGKQRWDYFRMNNRSHNTLVIGDKIQNPTADCKIIDFQQGGQLIGRAVVDLTDAYQDQVESARRTAALFQDGTVEIEDVLTGVTEPVRWGMMTRSAVKIDGKKAELSIKDKKIQAEVVSVNVKQFEILPATPETEKENQNKGFSILAVFAEPENGTVKINITLKSVK